MIVMKNDKNNKDLMEKSIKCSIVVYYINVF